jgi:hypothetical protein
MVRYRSMRDSFTIVPANKISRIFIIEGLVTVVLSFCSIFWIVPFPEKSNMFTPEEKAVLLARVADDGGQVSHDHFNLKSFVKNLSDWKIWIW